MFKQTTPSSIFNKINIQSPSHPEKHILRNKGCDGRFLIEGGRGSGDVLLIIFLCRRRSEIFEKQKGKCPLFRRSDETSE